MIQKIKNILFEADMSTGETERVEKEITDAITELVREAVGQDEKTEGYSFDKNIRIICCNQIKAEIRQKFLEAGIDIMK